MLFAAYFDSFVANPFTALCWSACNKQFFFLPPLSLSLYSSLYKYSVLCMHFRKGTLPWTPVYTSLIRKKGDLIEITRKTICWEIFEKFWVWERERKMGRPPCCDKVGVKKGPWTPEEDIILVSYIQEHGPGNWRSVPTNTGKINYFFLSI